MQLPLVLVDRKPLQQRLNLYQHHQVNFSTFKFFETKFISIFADFYDPKTKCSYGEWSNFTQCATCGQNAVRKKYRKALTHGLCRHLMQNESCNLGKCVNKFFAISLNQNYGCYQNQDLLGSVEFPSFDYCC